MVLSFPLLIPPITTSMATLVQSLAKYHPNLACKYDPDFTSYTPPPCGKSIDTLAESMDNLADSMAKLDIASKRLVASITNLVSMRTNNTRQQTTHDNTMHPIFMPPTSTQPIITLPTHNQHHTFDTKTDVTTPTFIISKPFPPITDISKPGKTINAVFMASTNATKIENVTTQLTNNTDVVNKTSPCFTDIKSPLTSSPFAGHRCKPPVFVFLRIEPKPPWKLRGKRENTMSLEDKTRFEARSIDTLPKSRSPLLHEEVIKVEYQVCILVA